MSFFGVETIKCFWLNEWIRWLSLNMDRKATTKLVNEILANGNEVTDTLQTQQFNRVKLFLFNWKKWLLFFGLNGIYCSKFNLM